MRVYKMFKCSECRKCPHDVDLTESLNEEIIAERRKKCANCTKRPPAEEIIGDLICHFFRQEMKEDTAFWEHKNKIKDMLRHGYGQVVITNELNLPISQTQKFCHLYGLQKQVEREKKEREKKEKKKKQ